MTRRPGLVSRHYLEYRLVAIYGGLYFFTLSVASIMFVKMMTTKFAHPLFWSWMGWTFVTTYCFFLFMRSILSPAVQVYPEMIVLSYPKVRTIKKSALKSFKVEDLVVELSFVENDKEEYLKIKLRPDYDIE